MALGSSQCCKPYNFVNKLPPFLVADFHVMIMMSSLGFYCSMGPKNTIEMHNLFAIVVNHLYWDQLSLMDFLHKI